MRYYEKHPPSCSDHHGYVTGQKGYRVLLNKSRKVLTSQNVAFIAYDKGVQHRMTNFANLKATNEVDFEIEQEPVQEHEQAPG